MIIVGAGVSIPYWLGSKLRGGEDMIIVGAGMFQSPIGWGLSCEEAAIWSAWRSTFVSIPYWLGSKLRVVSWIWLMGLMNDVSIPYWLGSKLRVRPRL